MKAERTPSLTSVSRNPTEEKRAVEGWHAPGRDGDGISLERLAELRAEPPGRVLSVYVDADARQGAASTPAGQIKLKDELSRLLDADLDHGSATALARLGQWTLERVKAELEPGALRRSLALFGTETPRRLEVLVLPQPVEAQAAWDAEPLLEPLRRMEERHPRMGIALLDGWHARLITSWLGMPVGETVLERDEDTSDWREMKGTAYFGNVAGGATQRDRYQARMREHTERWWRDLVPHLQRRSRVEGWAGLAVVADEHLSVDANELADAAHLPLVAQLHDALMYKASATVSEAVARATE
jgi:hypothetical protein